MFFLVMKVVFRSFFGVVVAGCVSAFSFSFAQEMWEEEEWEEIVLECEMELFDPPGVAPVSNPPLTSLSDISRPGTTGNPVGKRGKVPRKKGASLVFRHSEESRSGSQREKDLYLFQFFL